MSDFRERITALVDEGAPRISADEVLSRVPSTSTPRVSPRHRYRRLMWSGVAVVVLAALISAGVESLPGPRQISPQKVSAAEFLRRTAARALKQPALIPGPGKYLYVALLDAGLYGQRFGPAAKAFWFFADNLIQTWASPAGGDSVRETVVGQPQFLAARDRANWLADGGKPLGSGSDSGYTATYYDVANLPTSPSRMRAYFASQPYLTVQPGEGRDTAFEFNSALDFLQNGTSSVQRNALLRFISALPGIRLYGSGRSFATNRTGTLIGLPINRRGITEEALFDPSTSSLLEIRYVITNISYFKSGPKLGPQPDYSNGSVWTYTDFLFAGIANRNRVPANSPRLPKVWPFGALRTPAPGDIASRS